MIPWPKAARTARTCASRPSAGRVGNPRPVSVIPAVTAASVAPCARHSTRCDGFSAGRGVGQGCAASVSASSQLRSVTAVEGGGPGGSGRPAVRRTRDRRGTQSPRSALSVFPGSAMAAGRGTAPPEACPAPADGRGGEGSRSSAARPHRRSPQASPAPRCRTRPPVRRPQSSQSRAPVTVNDRPLRGITPLGREAKTQATLAGGNKARQLARIADRENNSVKGKATEQSCRR